MVDQTAQTVTFTVTWDNSWHLDAAAPPGNWDAVWVFVKWRSCASDPTTTDFTHGLIDATIDGVLNNWPDLEAMSTPCTAGIGGCGGADVDESVALGATFDILTGAGGTALGVMLRQSVQTFGSITSDVSLHIVNLPAIGTDIAVSVFGIEMVYIPKDNFDIGDATLGVLGATNRFTDGTNFALGAGDLLSPYKTVTTEATGTFYVNAPALLSGTRITAVPTAFPKGYYGFYMMKYEITQGQYAEFLTTLSSAAEQVTRWMGAANTIGGATPFRNTTNIVSTAASAARPDRAQNYLTYDDAAAYLDWACLRPMTELEYEKASRGPDPAQLPVLTEAANGVATASIVGPPTTISGVENGTEIVAIPAGCNVVYNVTIAYVGGDGTTGPLRAGIFATAGGTRVTAGASYYGVMELSGNVREIVVALASDAHGAAGGTSQLGTVNNTMTRTWGNGDVSVGGGNHDVLTWPVSGVATLAANTTNTIGQKGGDWATTAALVARTQTSDRFAIYNATTVITNTSTIGGRTASNNMSGGRGVR